MLTNPGNNLMKKSDINRSSNRKCIRKDKRSLFYKWSLYLFGIFLSILAYFLIFKNTFIKKSNQDYLDLPPIMPPFGQILKSIAIPRVSGSAGSIQIRNYIKSQFSLKYWDIEEDSHVIDSLHGKSTNFVNLIVTLKGSGNDDLENQNRLILAAHYDSKLLEAEGLEVESLSSLESKFIGASDSAWSCALMIAISSAICKEKINNPSMASKTNLQLIFFDGEEAIKEWGPLDSLYGSRALAKKWSNLPKDSPNSLDKINLMVLLDLLGTKEKVQFFTFHPQGTVPYDNFNKLIQIEKDLMTMTTYNDPNLLFSASRQFQGYKGNAVEDDHTPFLELNVPILHLIPIPFPSIWHTFKDTIEALDPEICERTSKIIYKFIRNKLI